MEQVIGMSLLLLAGAIALYVLINIAKLLLAFHARKCKYCGHIMTFKRVHEENGEESYDFHCEHCKAWERVSKEKFFKNKE